MKKIIGIFFVAVLFSPQYLLGQIIKPFPEGLAFEVGLGYNRLDWKINPNTEFQVETGEFSRKAFHLTPTFRLSYKIEPLSWLTLQPLIGYDVFGGSLEEQPNGYKDRILFKSIEAGLLINYKLNNLSIGSGIKYNKHLEVIQSHFGHAGVSDEPRSWDENDMSDFWFKKQSVDLGFRLSNQFRNVIISSEWWFALTDLESKDLNELLNIKKNRLTLLIGYQF